MSTFKHLHLEPLIKQQAAFTHQFHLVKVELVCRTIKTQPITNDCFITYGLMAVIIKWKSHRRACEEQKIRGMQMVEQQICCLKADIKQAKNSNLPCR